jgi:MFS transporter, SP family, arabinose:H+ symporter
MTHFLGVARSDTDPRAAEPSQEALTPLSGARLLGVACTVALGGFLVGFDATVISGAVPFIRDYFDLGGSAGGLELGWAVSSLGWGAMAGNLAAGLLNDRFGRRTVLLLAATLFLGSSLAAAFATSFAVFVAARICGGLGVGTAILTSPMYIAEIAPARLRGRLVSLNQLMIVLGISVSFFSNYFLLSLGDASWRWMLGVQAMPAMLFLLLLTRVPESPRWQVATRRLNWRDLLTARLRWVLLFGFGIAFFQQATGINAIFYYLPTIFGQAGGGLASAFGQSVFVGLVNLGMTFVAIWLIDRLGRRPLLIAGLTGMSATLLTISWAFHTAAPSMVILIAIAAYVASFAISLGPVMWVMLSEIFPNEQRAAAIGVVGFWNSLVSASVTLLFPKELSSWGPGGTFLAYGLVAAVGLLFIAVFAPETKGKTLEELAQILTPAVERNR